MGKSAGLDEEINGIVGALNLQYAALLDRVIVLLGDDSLWFGEGLTSLQSWLRWRCGMSTSTAAALVKIAERADDLPESVSAFQRGELSLDQIATIARLAPSWTDAQARDYGIVMTVPQLQRVLRKYPFPQIGSDGREVVDDEPTDAHGSEPDLASTSPERADPAESIAATNGVDDQGTVFEETCSMFELDDGTFRLIAHLDADTGRIVHRSLDEAHDRLFLDGQPGVNLVEALRAMAERSLDAVDDPARRNRFKVSMFITADSESSMVDSAGRRMPDAVRQHLTCDGAITPVLLENGMPVSVGRSQYIVPARTRTIIEHRDHGRCRVPGCTARLGLEVHHIIHWEHDGPTDTWNLVLVCGRHHRMHHRGRLSITGNADDPDGLEFRNEHGRIIALSGAAPNPPPRPTIGPADVYQHPDGGRLDPTAIWFQPPPEHVAELHERAPTAAAYLAAIAPPGC